MRRAGWGPRRGSAIAGPAGAAALVLACLAASPARLAGQEAPTPTAAPTASPAPAPTPPVEPTPPASPEATPASSPAGEVPWRELSYSAHKFFMGATTSIRVERIAAAALRTKARRPPKGRAVPLPAGDALALSVATELPFGRRERVTLWLDPATGAALAAEKTSLGGRPYHKLMRFVEGGLYTWRSEPRGAREAGRDPAAWSGRSEYLAAPAAAPPPGTPVADSYGLLYLVAAARLDRKDGSLRLVMLADEGFVELAFTAGGLTYRRAAFDLAWPGGSRRVDGNVLVRTVRATAHALGAGAGAEDVDLGFLGMRGALALDIEVGTGIPIAFSGRVEHIGDLTVRLDRAELRAPPAEAPPPPTAAPSASPTPPTAAALTAPGPAAGGPEAKQGRRAGPR